MRLRWLVLLPAVLLVACGSAPYSSTQGARIVRYSIASRLMKRSLKQVLVIPAGPSKGRPLVMLLHGRDSGADQLLGDPMFTELRRLGRNASVIPAALARTHGDPRRIAIGGPSMGGFGALDIARLHPHFCAVEADSAAIWPTTGQTVAGAFDGPADFARHDVMGAARHGNPYGRIPILVDVGKTDGLRWNDEQLANDLRAHGAGVTFRLQPGGHSGWRSRMGQYLSFYASALERCR